MNQLDQWVVEQVRPLLLPGETPQTAVWGVEYRTVGDLMTNKTSVPYHYAVFTSERCFLLNTAPDTGLMKTKATAICTGVKAVYELGHCTFVKQDTQAGEPYFQLVFGRGTFFGVSFPRESELSTQQSFGQAYLPWLKQAVESGALRTPERMARLEAARLAEEAAVAAAKAQQEAERAARKAQEAIEDAAHVRRTIDQQPAIFYYGTFAVAGSVLVPFAALLFCLYVVLGTIGDWSKSVDRLAKYRRERDQFGIEIGEREQRRYPVQILMFGFGGLLSIAAMGGVGGATVFARRTFRQKNAALRAELGLPAA